MGERPTGNARAMDYRFPPICRMRTTYITPGPASLDDMLQDIALGVYAADVHGGETAGGHFTFTAGRAYMIRGGRIAEPVRGVTVSGEVFATLSDIAMIGNDVLYVDGPGGCGKANQTPLPTTTGGPHVRLRKALIGG